MIVLGIDPGTATTGYGIINFQFPISNFQKKSNHPHLNPPSRRRKGGRELKLVSFGCIKTSSKQPLANRLKIIYNELSKIIKKYKPQLIAVEEVFFAKNTKTAIKVGHSRGVCLLVAANNKIPVYELTPLQIKQGLTGYGLSLIHI